MRGAEWEKLNVTFNFRGKAYCADLTRTMPHRFLFIADGGMTRKMAFEP